MPAEIRNCSYYSYADDADDPFLLKRLTNSMTTSITEMMSANLACTINMEITVVRIFINLPQTILFNANL